MSKTLRPLAILSFAAIFLSGCGGEGGAQKTDKAPEKEAKKTVDVSTGFDMISGDYYQVPSPNELFLIIKNSELPFREGVISVEAGNYVSSKELALNFGRITADIAYTASYEKFQESMDNFEQLRKIAGELGISYVFDQLMIDRVKNNMDNADSLEIISNSSYIQIIDLLEQNGESVTLSIISAGGFVESIYILSELIGEYEENNPMIQRLADQKLVLENILDYLNQHSEEEKVKEVIAEMQPISDVYLNLKEETTSPAKSEKDGKMVLGGNRVMMNQQEFEALKKAARAYRDSFSLMPSKPSKETHE